MSGSLACVGEVGCVFQVSFLTFLGGSDESDNRSAMTWGKERCREVKEREQTPLVTEDQPGIRMQNIMENRW